MRQRSTAPLLEEARWFWPLVLIPYSIEAAHTRTFTGREVARDIKVAWSRVRVVLTKDDLIVIGRLTGRSHLTIPRRSIVSAAPVQRKLVRIQFESAAWSGLIRAMSSGQPGADRHTILINSRRRDEWLDALNVAGDRPSEGEGPA